MIFKRAIFLGIFGVSSLVNAAPWSLEDCLKQAKEKSLQLEAAKLRELQADVAIKQAKTNRYPNLNANIQNTLYDQPFIDEPKDHYRLNLGLSSSYTLWDGGSTSLNIEASQLNKTASAFNTKQTERSIQESVLNAYISLLASSENVKMAQATVALSQAEFEHYGKLYEVGSITKKDLTQAQANLLQKQTNLLEAELQVSTAKTTLRQLLELGAEEEFEVDTLSVNWNNPDSLAALPELKELQTQVAENHPGLKADSLSIQAAKKNTELAGTGSSISVTLGANASTGLQAWESDRYGRQLKNGYQHSLTLGINIPIIDGGATASRVLMAQVNETESQINLQNQVKNLENNLERLYINALSADMQWRSAILQVEAETEALAVANEQRNAGAITYTDFLQQKNALENAQIQLLQAKYNSILSRNLLDLYQGKWD